MRVYVPALCTISIVFLSVLALPACTSEMVRLDEESHTAYLDQTHNQITQANTNSPTTLTLTLEEALKRAYHENYDARVSALEYLSTRRDIGLEQLKALPTVELSVTRLGRNKESASSSQSATTGLESLKSSISTQRIRQTEELSIDWKILDSALALIASGSADDRSKIAAERHKKVLQNVQRDTYVSFWSALAYQQTQADTQALIQDGRLKLEKLARAQSEKLISAKQAGHKRADISSKIQELMTLNDGLAVSSLELKSLISLPHRIDLKLVAPDKKVPPYRNYLKQDLNLLEKNALRHRPEMRESIVQSNISMRDILSEVVTTFPGVELFYAYNRDTNKFLADNRWGNFSASVVASLTRLITAPARIGAAKTRSEIERTRSVSTAAAIIAQVHLARHRLQVASDLYKEAMSAGKTASDLKKAAEKEKEAGFIGGMDLTKAQLDAQIERIKFLQAYITLQDSYAALMNSLGKPELSDIQNLISMTGGQNDPPV